MACHQDAPFQPLVRAAWITFPSDDELVEGIVGTGGTTAEHADVESAVREVVIPELHRESRGNLGKLERELDDLRRSWDLTSQRDVLTFMQLVLDRRVHRIALDATVLAEARLRHDLWPDEPYPEEWNGERAMSISDPNVAALPLERELDELAANWARYLGTSNVEPIARDMALARDMIHVARTGDYSKTAGQVYQVLNARRIGTMPDTATMGPW